MSGATHVRQSTRLPGLESTTQPCRVDIRLKTFQPPDSDPLVGALEGTACLLTSFDGIHALLWFSFRFPSSKAYLFLDVILIANDQRLDRTHVRQKVNSE